MEVRVATFNVRNGLAFDGCNSWPCRRRAVAATVRGLGAGVIGLQEVFRFQARWLLRTLPGHEGVGAGRDDGHRGERCFTLARREAFRVARWTTRWFSEEPDVPGSRLPQARFPRVVTFAEVVVRGSGATFGLANVHLDERNGANRVRSAELLLSWLDPALPWVVLGDFNDGPDGPVLAALRAAGLRSVLPADAPGTAHRFTGRTDGPRIDHVLVGPEWDVGAAAVRTAPPRRRLPSDHWPVVADLRLRTAP